MIYNTLLQIDIKFQKVAQVYFTVNMGRNLVTQAKVQLIEDVRLIWGPLIQVSLYNSDELIRAHNLSGVACEYIQHVKS